MEQVPPADVTGQGSVGGMLGEEPEEASPRTIQLLSGGCMCPRHCGTEEDRALVMAVWAEQWPFPVLTPCWAGPEQFCVD